MIGHVTSECSYEVKMVRGKKGPSRNAQTSSRIRAPTADQRDSNEDVDVGLPSTGTSQESSQMSTPGPLARRHVQRGRSSKVSTTSDSVPAANFFS